MIYSLLTQSLSLVFLLCLKYLFYFAELHKLVNALEGHPGILFNFVIVHQFIHIVRRNWSNYLFVLLIVPYISAFVQLTFVELVKKSEWPWPVVGLVLFLCLFLLFSPACH